MPEIESHIKNLLAEHLGLQPTIISGPQLLHEDLGADSLDFVELVMALEDFYGFEIDDASADKFTTVESVCSYVSARMQKA